MSCGCLPSVVLQSICLYLCLSFQLDFFHESIWEGSLNCACMEVPGLYNFLPFFSFSAW